MSIQRVSQLRWRAWLQTNAGRADNARHHHRRGRLYHVRAGRSASGKICSRSSKWAPMLVIMSGQSREAVRAVSAVWRPSPCLMRQLVEKCPIS